MTKVSSQISPRINGRVRELTLKEGVLGTREMTQLLKVAATLAEDLGSQIAAHNC